MTRLSEAAGRPVISRASAERLGDLKHVVVDPAARRITAIHVAGRRSRARLVDWSAIVGFGPDGIVVEDDGAAREPADERERAVASGHLDLERRLVLDDGGRALGVVEDVVFDATTGEVEAIAAGGEDVEAGRLLAIGPYCVIVRRAEAAPG